MHSLAEPVGRVVGKTGISPNALTIFGFCINFGVAWLVSQGYFVYGGILILAAGIFDLLDGAVARMTGKVTKFGALLDSTLDRYSEGVVLFGLLLYYVSKTDAVYKTECLLIFATIVGSILVSYVRARAEGLNLDAEVGIFRRTMRLSILSLGLMFSAIPEKPETVMLYTLWILAIGTNFTAVHRLVYVWFKTRFNKWFDSSKPKSKAQK